MYIYSKYMILQLTIQLAPPHPPKKWSRSITGINCKKIIIIFCFSNGPYILFCLKVIFGLLQASTRFFVEGGSKAPPSSHKGGAFSCKGGA